MKKPRVVIVGCGNTGLDARGSWVADHPENVDVVGLVDPQPSSLLHWTALSVSAEFR